MSEFIDAYLNLVWYVLLAYPLVSVVLIMLAQLTGGSHFAARVTSTLALPARMIARGLVLTLYGR